MKHQQIIDRKSIVQSGSFAVFLAVKRPMLDDSKTSKIYSTSSWRSLPMSVNGQMNYNAET